MLRAEDAGPGDRFLGKRFGRDWINRTDNQADSFPLARFCDYRNSLPCPTTGMAWLEIVVGAGKLYGKGIGSNLRFGRRNGNRAVEEGLRGQERDQQGL
jgi:hypothetical protein